MGYPRVRPHVVLAPGKTGVLTEHDFVTSFLVAWQPSPTAPPRTGSSSCGRPRSALRPSAPAISTGTAVLFDRASPRVRHRSLQHREARPGRFRQHRVRAEPGRL